MSTYNDPLKLRAIERRMEKLGRNFENSVFLFCPSLSKETNFPQRGHAKVLEQIGVRKVVWSDSLSTLQGHKFYDRSAMIFYIPFEENAMSKPHFPLNQGENTDEEKWLKRGEADNEEFRNLLVCNLQDLCAEGESGPTRYRRWLAKRFLSPLNLVQFYIRYEYKKGRRLRPYWGLVIIGFIPDDFTLEKKEVVIADILSEPVAA